MVIEYKYFKIPKIKFLTTALLNKKPGCDESSFMVDYRTRRVTCILHLSINNNYYYFDFG